MGVSVYCTVKGQSEDFAFDDVARLNADLLETEIGRYDAEHGQNGRLFTVDGGAVGLVDLESGCEGDESSIWCLFDETLKGIVARHVASGWLELGHEVEEGGTTLFRFTPGAHERVGSLSG